MTLDDAARAALDAALERLGSGTKIWTALTAPQRVRLIERTRTAVASAADDWVAAAMRMKRLSRDDRARGEEWATGPYALLNALDAYADSLRARAAGRSPLAGRHARPAPGGRTSISAFPRTGRDRLSLPGYRGWVWTAPGVTAEQARATAGRPAATGTTEIGLVLGAGNITSIPPLDALYELLAHDRVSILKLNPTMDALRPVFERAFAPLIEPGLLAVVTGGAPEGEYLSAHERIAHVHITGSAATFDAIVWGTGDEAERRRRDQQPVLSTPITAELGGVSPIIVVPGRWRDADLRTQAEHIATMRLYNSGHNCIAGQVVIVSSEWDQREDFLAALRTAYQNAPDRPLWYPHSHERVARARAAHPDAWTGADGERLLVVDGGLDDIEQTEYFAPVLGVVQIAGRGSAFLDAAVTHANERLTGSLGANVLIDPRTERDLGTAFDQALANLHYGSIAVNAWTGVSFILPTLSWGAYPGGTPAAVGSGLGIVHNAFLIDDVERSILRGPFRPFPRPPWFVSSRTGGRVLELLTRFLIDGRVSRLIRAYAAALRS